MSRRRKGLLTASIATLLIIIAILLLNQPPSAPASQTAPIVPDQVPPKLLVVPEVPFGTIAIVLASFLAFLVVFRNPRSNQPKDHRSQ